MENKGHRCTRCKKDVTEPKDGRCPHCGGMLYCVLELTAAELMGEELKDE